MESPARIERHAFTDEAYGGGGYAAFRLVIHYDENGRVDASPVDGQQGMKPFLLEGGFFEHLDLEPQVFTGFFRPLGERLRRDKVAGLVDQVEYLQLGGGDMAHALEDLLCLFPPVFRKEYLDGGLVFPEKARVCCPPFCTCLTGSAPGKYR